jgi:hypothetical protein
MWLIWNSEQTVIYVYSINGWAFITETEFFLLRIANERTDRLTNQPTN